MYGFNGQEKDDEVSSSGNTNAAMFWEYDTRLGRRWNLDPKPNPSFSGYMCFSNNPIFFTAIKGDEVYTKLDRRTRKKLGISRKQAKNYTPAMVKKMFQEEYGINVEMKNGKLVYAGEVATTQPVSQTAKEMWIKELAPGFVSKHSIVFTYNNKKIDIGENQPLEEGRKPPSTTFIDLGDFNPDMSFAGSTYYNVPVRAANLGRVMEHEFLVHGVMGLRDDFSQSSNSNNNGAFDPNKMAGNTVIYANIFARQMGLPERSIYGSTSGGTWKEGNKTKAFHVITFSNHGSIVTKFDVK